MSIATSRPPTVSPARPPTAAPSSSSCRRSGPSSAVPRSWSSTPRRSRTAPRSAGPAAPPAELQIDLIAGSFVERRDGQAEDLEHQPPRRPRRSDQGGVPQAAHVRRRGRRHHLRRVRARAGRRRGRRRRPLATQARHARHEHLLRPALPRALPRTLERGATLLAVPAAFTLATTRDHWETLLRARAIENQCFVIAANQIGEYPPGNRSGGRSLIVDPWGVVLATAPDSEMRDRRRPRLRPARATCAGACLRSTTAAPAQLYEPGRGAERR